MLARVLSGDCVVGLHVEGPTIETVEAYTLTRADTTVRFTLTALHCVFYGPHFDHAAAPTRPVAGSVRDRDTGKPIAGATIRARVRTFVGHTERFARTATDPDGHYRLVGLAHDEGYATPPPQKSEQTSVRFSPRVCISVRTRNARPARHASLTDREAPRPG
jgi:hypothetical protein